MKFFIDTANIEDIKKANALGIVAGVTTNPSLIAKEGRDFKEVIKEITDIVDGPISGEVKATTSKAEDMIEEARAIAAIHKNMVVKIPMTEEGLKAVHVLSRENIKTNVTLIFSANQALLAARAGASYVSPFLGRLDDISQPGIGLIEDIVQIFENYDIKTEIIAASIRNPIHVMDCAMAGADIATVPYSVMKQMIRHPLTDAGIEKFIKDSKIAEGAKEKSIEIKDVTDKSFACYGKVVADMDLSDMVKALADITPPDDVVYEPSEEKLEKTFSQEDAVRLFGGQEVQVGYCAGHNRKLNAVEYHKNSEINVAGTDAILILGKVWDIESDGSYNTSLMEAYKIPAGCAVELYATTLHYAPVQVSEAGFSVGVILPKGTNTPVAKSETNNICDKQLAANNKWLIGHAEGGLPEGTFIGLKGENITI